MNRIVVGVDIAKRLFQLHWVEPQTGEIVALQLKREKFLEHFANRSSCLQSAWKRAADRNTGRDRCRSSVTR